MASMATKLSGAAQTIGLSFDFNSDILYGVFHGYTFAIKQSNTQTNYFAVFFHVSRDGDPFSNEDGAQIAHDSNKLVRYNKSVGASVAHFLVKPMRNEQDTARKIEEVLTYLSNSFTDRGYVNACDLCHQPAETQVYAVGNGLRLLCPTCRESVSSHITEKAQVEAETPENVVAGIVGALGGALLGAASVVFFSRLGYVSALSGVIAAVCSLKGYELMAKKMSVKGAVISCIAMLVLIYVGHRADWAIDVAKYFEVDFFTAFRAIPMLIKEEAIEKSTYYGGVAMVYLFAVAGAVPTVIRSLKAQKQKYTVRRLS